MYSREKIFNVFDEIIEESKTIKPYVLIAQPRRDLTETPAQNFDAAIGIHINLDGFSHAFCNIGGEKVDVARNYLFEQALEANPKYLLFVGEDTVLPYDAFFKLHEIAEQNPDSMVTGVYYVKLSIPMIMVKKDEFIVPANVDPGQIIEAYQTGLDAALIPLSIIKALKEEDPEIPFCCIGNNIGSDKNIFIGEDNFFQYRLRKNGFRTLVNTDVQCLHCDLVTGKYTAHPSVENKMYEYFTNIKMTTPFTIKDKEYLDMRWFSRIPKNEEEK